jgi:hypothetical protein
MEGEAVDERASPSGRRRDLGPWFGERHRQLHGLGPGVVECVELVVDDGVGVATCEQARDATDDANGEHEDVLVGGRWQRVKPDRAVGLLVPHTLRDERMEMQVGVHERAPELDCRGGSGWQGLIASADGPIVTSNTFEAIALSASDGTQRWTQQNAGIMRAAAGGSVRLTSGQTATATVSSLHPGGDERWRQTLSADSRVWLHDATAMPDGSLIVTGRFERTNLRVGDLTLDGTDPISFIAGLDATGSALWGLTVPSADVLHVVENHGDIVIAGRYWGTGLGLPEADEAESFVAVVTPEGVTRAHAIGGRGDQYLHDLVPASEGVVWAAVDNAYGGEIDENIDPILRVGSWSYDGAAQLVLGLAY